MIVGCPPSGGPASVGCLDRRSVAMSKICQVTGRKPSFGNSISHSHRKTRRRWDPNIQKQRFWIASERRWVTLRVSAKGIKTINKKGIDAVLAEMRQRGVKL
jgi:large subunit ribosomal protein L28